MKNILKDNLNYTPKHSHLHLPDRAVLWLMTRYAPWLYRWFAYPIKLAVLKSILPPWMQMSSIRLTVE